MKSGDQTRDDVRVQRRGAKVVSVWVKANTETEAESVLHRVRMEQLNQDAELARFDLARGRFEPIGSGWMAARRVG